MRTTGAPPAYLKRVNRVLVGLRRIGLPVHTLTVVGRRSGLARTTPLTVLEVGGQRYLCAGFPRADWAANARAAGAGVLHRGRRSERVRLVELSAEEARPIWRASAASGSGTDVMKEAGVITDGTPEEFESLAGVCPVFRLEPH